jgi:hypothetical protein
VTQHDSTTRAICRERCAYMGEPPCWEVGAWPNEECDEPGCAALAEAAIAAWNRRAPGYAAGAEAMREAAAGYHTMLAEASGGPDRADETNAYATMRRLRAEYHRIDAAAIRALPIPELPQ